METKRTRRTFTHEFKKQAAERVVVGNEKTTVVAQELGINPVSLYQWVREYEAKGQGLNKSLSADSETQPEINTQKNQQVQLSEKHIATSVQPSQQQADLAQKQPSAFSQQKAEGADLTKEQSIGVKEVSKVAPSINMPNEEKQIFKSTAPVPPQPSQANTSTTRTTPSTMNERPQEPQQKPAVQAQPEGFQIKFCTIHSSKEEAIRAGQEALASRQHQLSAKAHTAQSAPASQPEVEQAPKTTVKVAPQPEVNAQLRPAVEPTTKPVVENSPHPTVASRPSVEPKPRPTVELSPKQIVEAPRPTVEPSQPSVEPASHPVVEPPPRPEVVVSPRPAVEPPPRPEVAVSPRPVIEPTLRHVSEVSQRPVVESSRPIVEPKPRPAVEVPPRPAVEAAPRPTLRVAPEPPAPPVVSPPRSSTLNLPERNRRNFQSQERQTPPVQQRGNDDARRRIYEREERFAPDLSTAETLSDFSQSTESPTPPAQEQYQERNSREQNRDFRQKQKKNKQYGNERYQNRNDNRNDYRNDNRSDLDDVQPERVVPERPPRPVPTAAEGRSWKVKGALSQRPNYREENEKHGYVDEFSIPAKNLDEVWQILSIMQDSVDKRAFSDMVHSRQLNVSEELLEDPKACTMQGPIVPNKPWLRKPRMNQVAEEFFQTTPEYAKSVYENYCGLDIRLDKNSDGTPILSVQKTPTGERSITIDFSKFDRFVDDFYGDFVRECKEVMMKRNPREYSSLNSFIRIPDEPLWNPKLWAGVRTFTWNPNESLSEAWINYASNNQRKNQRYR
ncbi:MAG: transposase [Burkholderiales bacterium]|nr:transposase [Burkholderiales bacterium]